MTTKLLIIKLSSMGDLMHPFAALSAAKTHHPNLEVDWVVDQSFAAVPLWHPAVNKVIISNHRNWKKNIFKKTTRLEIAELKQQMNAKSYDFIVDLQGNLKSAMIGRLCNQPVWGMDCHSVREKPAHLFYQKSWFIAKNQHAIQRQSQLLAAALNYPNQQSPTSGSINRHAFIKPTHVNLPKHYVVLVQNASWPSKLWPIDSWQAVITALAKQGIRSLITAGNAAELQRAKAIAAVDPYAEALPLMPLNEMAYIIDHAKCCVCSDTGLAHLSALVATPAVTLYGPTDPKLIGTVGPQQHHLVGANHDMNNISPVQVLKQLNKLLQLEEWPHA